MTIGLVFKHRKFNPMQYVFLISVLNITMSKRKCLTLEERVKAIQYIVSGLSSGIIADKFGIGRTQIQNILSENRN